MEAVKILNLRNKEAITISVNINRFSLSTLPGTRADLLYFPFYLSLWDNYDIFIITRRPFEDTREMY